MRPCRPYSADTRPQTGLSRQNVPRPNLLARSAMLARRAAAQDHILRPLVVTGALALGILAPRGHRMTATRGTTFTTTMRMVDRVHRHTADGRANAEPALPARLAHVGFLVVRVGPRTDGGHEISQS